MAKSEQSDVYDESSEEEQRPLLDSKAPPETDPYVQANGHLQSGADSVQDEVSPPRRQRFTRGQIVTFVSLCITTLLVNASFSILTPFFPVEAQHKGATQTQIGFIFGIYALIAFLASPFFGKFLPVIGAKFMFIGGLWIQSGCNVLFGVLDYIEDDETFIIYCFVIRAVGSIGSAASATANFAIIAAAFPDNIGQVIGYNEMFSGFGLMLGPPLGGVLYEVGGYKLPFLALGGLCTLSVFLNMLLLPRYGIADRKMGSLRELLTIFPVWPVMFAVAVSSGVLGFLDPTLALFLKQFNITPLVVGLLFLFGGGIYGISAPLWGYLVDKKDITRIMIMMGFLFLAISFLVMGSSPLFNLEPQLKYVIYGLPVFGIGLGWAIVPTFNDMLSSARWYGMADDLSTHSIVSGVFQSTFQLGNFAGPTIGSALVQHVGFQWGSTVIAGLCIFTTLLVLFVDLWEYRCGNGRRPPPASRSKIFLSDADNDGSERHVNGSHTHVQGTASGYHQNTEVDILW